MPTLLLGLLVGLSVLAAFRAHGVSLNAPKETYQDHRATPFATVSLGRKVAAPGTGAHEKRQHMMSRMHRQLLLGDSPYAKGTNLDVGGSIWPTSVFYTAVQVGTPAKSYAVTIDSGSGSLFLPGKSCDGCVTNAPNVQYDPNASNTSQKVLGKFGNFSATYLTCDPTHPLQTCTISGETYNDMVTLAGYGPAEVMLGVIDYQTSNFYQFQDIDGIMGMVGGENSTVFRQLCGGGSATFCPSNVWAICLNEGIFSNGTLTVGGVDPRLSKGPIQYVPRVGPRSHYFVTTVEVGLETKTLSVTISKPPGGIMTGLDTGTNDLLLPTEVYNKTKEILCTFGASHCEGLFNGSCYALSDEEVDAYPSITLGLENNVTLKMDSRKYLLKNSPAAKNPSTEYCLGLGDGGELFLIGDTLMSNYYLVFGDHEIGWGDVNKDLCGSI